jgi:hypothetical protein
VKPPGTMCEVISAYMDGDYNRWQGRFSNRVAVRKTYR